MLLEKTRKKQRVFCSINFDELKKLVNKKNYRILATIEKMGYKEAFTRFLNEDIELEFYENDDYYYDDDGYYFPSILPNIKWYNDNIRNQWECYKEFYIK